jgi:hypothetical protein
MFLAHPKVHIKSCVCYEEMQSGWMGWYTFDSYRGQQIMHVRPGAVCYWNKEWK